MSWVTLLVRGSGFGGLLALELPFAPHLVQVSPDFLFALASCHEFSTVGPEILLKPNPLAHW